jgi:AraC-like DNA-binding protein
MRQSEIFAGQPDDPDSLIESTSRKYEKSTLKPEDAEKYFEKLQSTMQADKPYLENNLTLPALAGKMKISVHHLSQIINDKARQNFFEFINSYRVEEAQRLFRDPQKQQLTIAAICYETGFNSLSSFNTLFKKLSGVTPSQYRKNQPSQE